MASVLVMVVLKWVFSVCVCAWLNCFVTNSSFFNTYLLRKLVIEGVIAFQTNRQTWTVFVFDLQDISLSDEMIFRSSFRLRLGCRHGPPV